MQQITSEEMEVLNRANEILSKYANRGKLTQSDLDQFERLVISIIDGDDDDTAHSPAKQSEAIAETKGTSNLYPTTKYRVNESLYFEGRKTFSVTVQVPIDEFISQVAIRFVHDPVFL